MENIKQCPRCKHKFDVLKQQSSSTYVFCPECNKLFDYCELFGWKKWAIGILGGVILMAFGVIVSMVLSNSLNELLRSITGISK